MQKVENHKQLQLLHTQKDLKQKHLDMLHMQKEEIILIMMVMEIFHRYLQKQLQLLPIPQELNDKINSRMQQK